VAGGERIYAGYIQSMSSSQWISGYPVIVVPQFYADDVIHIIQANFPEGEAKSDVRQDERIRTALEKSGKLNLGLSVELTGATYIASPNGNAMKCGIRITNRSDAKIYFPDPEKMGGQTLVYYTGGIYLLQGTQAFGYQNDGSEIKKIEWKKEWYSPLEAHQTVTRTVIEGGFPDVPEGRYRCSLIFGGPTDIVKSERNLADGSIWLGVIEVSPLEITVQRQAE
jgi:hypothetical protein